MKPTPFFTALALLFAGQLMAANVTSSKRFDEKWPLSAGGTFVLTNPVGNIEIIGVEGSDVTATVTKTVIGVDQKALDVGHDRTELRSGGNAETLFVTTLIPAARDPRWSSSVTYQVRVPRTAHVRVSSNRAERVRIANIRGNVLVKAFNGVISLENVSGASEVQSANGSLIYIADRPVANAHLETINGSVQVVVSPTANFQWVAETLTGDFRSTIPARGELKGTSYRGNVNAPGGPTITTISMMGTVFLLEKGLTPQQTASVREMSTTRASASAPPPTANEVQHDVWQGRFTFNANIGSVRVSEIRGDAHVTMGAGEVRLGSVTGSCSVTSEGGPLYLGEIFGNLVARTRAGDIVVDAARDGGYLGTAGGMIRVTYTGGPTTLTSGGGDIVVRQAAGPLSAVTRSGDVNVTVDPSQKTQRVEAKTSKGNVVLSISPRFAADIEATVITADPTANMIKSDFPGLSITREDAGGGKTRIRAIGKINGGGEKVDLTAEGGGIQILSRGR